MRFHIRLAAAAAMVAGLTACSDSTDPDDESPVVVLLAAASAPQPPAGTVVACFTGPDAATASTNCPVVRWKGITFWAFSYEDQHNSMNIVAYDEDENIVRQTEEEGSRSLWQITVNTNSQTVVFWGQGSATITLPWSELEISQ